MQNLQLNSLSHTFHIQQQRQAHDEFSTSLMSVGHTIDNSNMSIFTKDDVKVYREEDVLITYKGVAILIGKRDKRSRYRIPLMQNRGQWQTRRPTKKSK